ncbi:MAG: hypothetical protein H7124_15160 [Phycisphaerales bacterium]|nr:hypothetical protein [Hyphomonadaceae bacterium]
MAEKQALNATFFAFRKRERGGVLMRASIAFLIGAIVLIAAFVALFWSSLGPIAAWFGQIVVAGVNEDNAAIEAAGFPPEFFGLIGGLLLWLFPFYILYAAYEAACLRWMVHGENVGFMGLSLGAPTWRVWSVYWIWFLLNIAFSIAVGIIAAVLVGALIFSTGNQAAAETLNPVLELIQYIVMIYFSVRLAPAAATTIARRRFAFFDAWKVTKGRFWSLLGSFVLLWLFSILATIILSVAGFTTLMSGVTVDWTALGDPERSTAAFVELMQTYLQSLMQPRAWLAMGALWLIGQVVGIVFYVACYGVNARAAQVALEEGKISPA